MADFEPYDPAKHGEAVAAAAPGFEPYNPAKHGEPVAASPTLLQDWGADAAHVAGGIYNMVRHPVDTAEGIWDLPKGIASKGMQATGLTNAIAGVGQTPEGASLNRDIEAQKAGFREKSLDAFVAQKVQDYGSLNAAGQTALHRPFSTAMDLSAILAPASAGKNLPVIGRTLGAVDKLGEVINPLYTPIKGTAAAIDAIGAVAKYPLSVLSGLPVASQSAIAQDAIAGGTAARAAMRGSLQGDEVVGKILDAADQLAIDKNAARAADAAKWNIPGAMADVSGVHKALDDALKANKTSLGAVKNTQAEAALQRLSEVLDQHTTIPAHEGFGPAKVAKLGVEDTDALKQAIGEVMYDRNMAPKGSVASVLTRKVYDAAKNAITDVSPQYAAAMERSQEAIRNLQNIRREFSLKDNVSPGTVLAKIQSAMRNDVSSRFGYRGELLKQLAAKDPSIPAAVAGQDASSWMPRGLTGRLGAALTLHGGVGALTGGVSAPLAIPYLAASSPRVVGETINAINRARRPISAASSAIGRVVPPIGLLGSSNPSPRGILSP